MGYVLIVDELNRTNPARVFGELFYMLENRDKPTKLQYGSVAWLPSNLYIIGTMNLADRNLRHIDLALTQRFAWVEAYCSQSDDPAKEQLGRIVKSIECRNPFPLDGIASIVDSSRPFDLVFATA